MCRSVGVVSTFLSTLSLRRATVHCGYNPALQRFLSTLSLRRATLTEINKLATGQISIHALLAESDWGPRWTECHLPPFLSTLSLRRATTVADLCKRDIRFLSTLSLRRATSAVPFWASVHQISIHALLAESDRQLHGTLSAIQTFLSTLSLRRATFPGADLVGNSQFLSTLSLRRATATLDIIPQSHIIFLSTLSLRRATLPWTTSRKADRYISIHALLAESDSDALAAVSTLLISIHALLAESDRYPRSAFSTNRRISIHALLAESDQ